MSTELSTTQTDSLTKFGHRDQIREMTERIRHMVPGAERAPNAVILAAAQKAIAHELDLFDGEVYLMEIKGQWSAHVGIRGLRRNAQGKYMLEDSDEYPRRMSDEELKADLGDSYQKGAIGVEVRLYNLPMARKCKDAGVPYFARRERGVWVPGERVPNGRTPAWVAQKRAEKAALTAEFPLAFVGDADDDDAIEYVEWKLTQHDRETAIEAPRRNTTDDDAIFAVEAPPANYENEVEFMATEDAHQDTPEPPQRLVAKQKGNGGTATPSDAWKPSAAHIRLFDAIKATQGDATDKKTSDDWRHECIRRYTASQDDSETLTSATELTPVAAAQMAAAFEKNVAYYTKAFAEWYTAEAEIPA